MIDELKLRRYDVLLWMYYQLYTKEYAEGGTTDDERRQLKDIFLETSRLAVELLSDFYGVPTEAITPEAIDQFLDVACRDELVWFPKHWKMLYHGLVCRILEDRMMPMSTPLSLPCNGRGITGFSPPWSRMGS